MPLCESAARGWMWDLIQSALRGVLCGVLMVWWVCVLGVWMLLRGWLCAKLRLLLSLVLWSVL